MKRKAQSRKSKHSSPPSFGKILKCPECGVGADGISLKPAVSPKTGKPYQYVKLKPCGHDMGKED